MKYKEVVMRELLLNCTVKHKNWGYSEMRKMGLTFFGSKVQLCSRTLLEYEN